LPRASKALDAKQVGKKAAAPAATAKNEANAARGAAAKRVDAPKQKADVVKRAPKARRSREAPAQAQSAQALPDKFLQEQLALLDAERAAYEEQAMVLKAQADQLAQEMEPGDIQFDDESGEGGTANVDRERDLALSAQARVAVDEIDHARQKIASGTYGDCESCGQPIPRARLKALPHARLCVTCKSGGLSRR
jgi:DnaK suppressor protein